MITAVDVALPVGVLPPFVVALKVTVLEVEPLDFVAFGNETEL